jgi:hypothetical protein
MKALLLVLFLAGCAVAADKAADKPPEPEPIMPLSLLAVALCGNLMGVMVTFTDGTATGYSAEELEANPPLAAALQTLPATLVTLESPEICGCAT